MNKCFRLVRNPNSIIEQFAGGDTYYARPVSFLKGREDKIVELLKKCEKDGAVDGVQLQNVLFPSVKKKVFISHSHSDEKMALYVAGNLGYNNCFIDTQVWSSVGEVISTVQRKYGCISDLKKMNSVYAHFYSMLAVALQNIIAELPVFLYIPPLDATKRAGCMVQNSPWIYQEISFAQHLHNTLRQGMLKESSVRGEVMVNAAHVEYPQNVDFMTPVSLSNITSILH